MKRTYIDTILNDNDKIKALEKNEEDLYKTEIALSIWCEIVRILKDEKNQTKKFTKREINKIEKICDNKLKIIFDKSCLYHLSFIIFSNDLFKHNDIQDDIYINVDKVNEIIEKIEYKIYSLENRITFLKNNIERIKNEDVISLHNKKMNELDKLIEEINELKRVLYLDY